MVARIEFSMPSAARIQKAQDLYVKDLSRAVGKQRDKGRKMLEGVTSNWKKRPSWEEKESLKQDGNSLDLEMTLTTTDTPYVFVTLGTKDRPAVFSIDFVAKTKKGKLKSGGGAGRVIARGALARRIQGGRKSTIEGRDFEGTVATKQKDSFAKDIVTVSNRAAKRFGVKSDVVAIITLPV